MNLSDPLEPDATQTLTSQTAVNATDDAVDTAPMDTESAARINHHDISIVNALGNKPSRLA